MAVVVAAKAERSAHHLRLIRVRIVGCIDSLVVVVCVTRNQPTLFPRTSAHEGCARSVRRDTQAPIERCTPGNKWRKIGCASDRSPPYYTVLHDESLKSGAWNSKGAVGD
jgi:hypothetical protein